MSRLRRAGMQPGGGWLLVALVRMSPGDPRGLVPWCLGELALGSSELRDGSRPAQRPL